VEAADLGGDEVGVLAPEVDNGDGVVGHDSRVSYPGPEGEWSTRRRRLVNNAGVQARGKGTR
jgi:hypothetical protein